MQVEPVQRLHPAEGVDRQLRQLVVAQVQRLQRRGYRPEIKYFLVHQKLSQTDWIMLSWI